MALYSPKWSTIYIINEKNANYINQFVPPKADFDIFTCIPVSYDEIL